MLDQHESSRDRDLRRSPAQKPRRNPRGRPFAEGNPGRPEGARGRATLLAEQILEERTAELMDALIDLAKAGNPTAVRVVLDLVLPHRRHAPTFDLPAVTNAADAVAALHAIPARVAAGQLDPHAGDKVSALLHRTFRASLAQETRSPPKKVPFTPQPIQRRQEPMEEVSAGAAANTEWLKQKDRGDPDWNPIAPTHRPDWPEKLQAILQQRRAAAALTAAGQAGPGQAVPAPGAPA